MKLTRKTFSSLLSHRALARYLGLPIVLWFLSGIVMVFISYPRLDSSQRVEFSGSLESSSQIPSGLEGSFSLESVLGRPRVKIAKKMVEPAVTSRAEIEQRLAALGKSEFKFLENIERDQWTVQGRYNRHRPFLVFENNEAKKLYISSKTGELVLVTSLFERATNYLGTVIHWIYFPAIRSHPALWGDVIIYLSMFALF